MIKYQAVYRIRSRIDELEADIEILEDHHPELLDEPREVVYEND